MWLGSRHVPKLTAPAGCVCMCFESVVPTPLHEWAPRAGAGPEHKTHDTMLDAAGDAMRDECYHVLSSERRPGSDGGENGECATVNAADR